MLAQFLEKLDTDTLTLLTRFIMRGVRSGDLNGYVKRHVRRLLEEEDAPEPPAAPFVSSKVVPRR